MAKLNAFRVNSKAIETGEWVKPGEEFDDLEFKTRGYTDAYTDARAAKMRKASLRYSGDAGKIPNAESRRIIIDLLIEHVLQDVRGISDEDGKAIDFATFCDLLRDPDYSPLFGAVLAAVQKVGQVRDAEKVAAAGN